MSTPRSSLQRLAHGSAYRATALLLGAAVAWSSVAAAEDAPAPVAPPAPAPAPPPTPAPAPPPTPGRFPGPESAGPRVGREQMWPAPTAEDWQKPCLLTWQRTWDDAVAVSRETGKAILICINMDGEIASEHYAGVRYRQEEIAPLYDPYVTVIASVYRHTPRDHDEAGRRIPCPRFGGVTCGEHISIEPVIFEKYCDGKRIAPRHIMVELDGKETYDVYYRNDTASVFQAIKDGISTRAPGPPIVVRGDRPILERVASREVSDRAAVEAAYQAGDPALRRTLLEAAVKNGEAAQLDLLRLAIFGLDVDMSRTARQALTKVDAPEATGLVADALRVPMDAAERAAMVAALKRLGATSPLARWLAVVHEGLGGAPGAVDPKAWNPPPGAGAPPASVSAPAGGTLEYELNAKAEGSKERPKDPVARLEFAEASLALAMDPDTTNGADRARARILKRALLGDARTAGREAEALGATGWRVNSVLALSSYYAGDLPDAYARAAKAVKEVPPGDTSWGSMAVLSIFAESRWGAIKKAVKEKLDFPPEWLTDVHAAYSVLLKHPLGTDQQVLWHFDLLDWLGAYDQAERILRSGLTRFRDSAAIHERLRAHILKRHGPAGLATAYDSLLAEQGPSAVLLSYAGKAAVAAAEQHRRVRAYDKASDDYARAIDHFERALAADPFWRDGADHAVALALAGRARLALLLGRDAAALTDVLASFTRRPASAGTRDGMGITPGETAQMLLARLKEKKMGDDVLQLEEALARIDADLLKPDGE